MRKDNYGGEDWNFRKKVLSDLVGNMFYEKTGSHSIVYEKKAAALYHQYVRDDKYISYLEAPVVCHDKVIQILFCGC